MILIRFVVSCFAIHCGEAVVRSIDGSGGCKRFLSEKYCSIVYQAQYVGTNAVIAKLVVVDTMHAQVYSGSNFGLRTQKLRLKCNVVVLCFVSPLNAATLYCSHSFKKRIL